MVLVGYVPLTPILGAVEGGNEALTVGWSWPSGMNPATDATLLGVQLFCQRGADSQVFQSGTFGAAYMTPAMLCPNATTTPTPSGSFSNLDPKYLCSGHIPPTTTNHRITGLQNGIPYGVGVAAVDKYGNIGVLSEVVYATPSAGTGGTGGALGGSPADGAVGSSDGGTQAKLGNGCSFDMRGRRDRTETAEILWLAVVTLAFATKSLRSRPRVQ